MSKIEFNEYAQTKDEFNTNDIYRLIQSGGSIVWSWGANKFINFFGRALTFRVNGFKHSGVVAITYDRVPDLFNVELRNSHYNLVDEVKGVYVDQLIEVIDSLVETDNDKSEEYREQVENATYKI